MRVKQRKTKGYVKGADEIVKALMKMEDEAAKVLLLAATEGGKIAHAYAKNKCPVDTGNLKDGITLTPKKATKTKAEALIEVGREISYGASVELGGSGRKEKPFLRPALDENQSKINETIAKSIMEAVAGKW